MREDHSEKKGRISTKKNLFLSILNKQKNLTKKVFDPETFRRGVYLKRVFMESFGLFCGLSTKIRSMSQCKDLKTARDLGLLAEKMQ